MIYCTRPGGHFPNKITPSGVNLVKAQDRKDDPVLAMLPETIETGLIEKSRQGDRSSFGELVCQYQPGVVHVVYRMCSDLDLAEDAAQEAFLRAWLHLDSFQTGSSLRNWLYRIAINVALDRLRREKGTLQDLETIEVADPAEGPEAELLHKETRQRVQQAIQSLSEANRAVLVLREYGSLSYQEIAGTLDIPIGTVMSRLNYARSRVRDLLEIDHD